MEKKNVFKLLLYLILWVFLIKDFGIGLWRAIIYIGATLILYFETLGKYEIDWLMWLKIYVALLAIWVLKRIIQKGLPSEDFSFRYLFY